MGSFATMSVVKQVSCLFHNEIADKFMVEIRSRSEMLDETVDVRRSFFILFY